ncbi:MAG: hypothetical protein LBH55_02225 [Mycoplasmataceae bacterium]|jgi:ribosomal protein L17|nr:hypothetical protein [Mycoplasmataceae bacterium]
MKIKSHSKIAKQLREECEKLIITNKHLQKTTRRYTEMFNIQKKLMDDYLQKIRTKKI